MVQTYEGFFRGRAAGAARGAGGSGESAGGSGESAGGRMTHCGYTI